MSALAGIATSLLARARADQVATLYARWHLTSMSMAFGATMFCVVMWDHVSIVAAAIWLALIGVNQMWRAALARAWRRARPGLAAAPRWGRYWSYGSAIAGALWGVAAWVTFPASPPHEALLIVCLFGVALCGLNLTAVYRPSLYGFVLPALAPLIVRVALVGDSVHFYTAAVMTVVLAFVLGFGHHLNDVLTQSLAMRYENLDLIGELRERTRSAHEARTAAETANRGKSQLLAAASHDLRQPLHALGLYVAALAARESGGECGTMVASVQRAVEALDTQFEQLLDLSRLEAGALRPQRGTVALQPLLLDVTAEFTGLAAERGIALRVVPTRLAVDSDIALLGRIVRNLVANAVRHTCRGGVVLGARRRGRRISIDVVDTGIGIAVEHQTRIFEEFYQIHDATRATRNHGGMGLGLAIVRRLTDLLGHGVEVASRVGRGSRFSILAPRVNSPVRALSPPRTASLIPGRSRPNALSGALIAVLDDDMAAVDAMQSLFTAWGAIIAGGTTVTAVLDACGHLNRYPDLIVADLRLEHGLNGVDAVAQIRRELGFDVPAMIVSGDTGAVAERRVEQAGLTLFAKPVVAAKLETAARALIASRRSLPVP